MIENHYGTWQDMVYYWQKHRQAIEADETPTS